MRLIVMALISLSIIWFAGCGDSRGDSLCANPAPVFGTYDPQAPGYIVLLDEGVDPAAEANRLASLYGFELSDVYQTVPGFSATFSNEILEQLRCESTVASISHDQTAYITDTLGTQLSK